MHRDEQKKADQKQNEFNKVSEDAKVAALNDQLGINFVQTNSDIATHVLSSVKNTKKSEHGVLHQKILLQLLKEDADPFNILSPQM